MDTPKEQWGKKGLGASVYEILRLVRSHGLQSTAETADVTALEKLFVTSESLNEVLYSTLRDSLSHSYVVLLALLNYGIQK